MATVALGLVCVPFSERVPRLFEGFFWHFRALRYGGGAVAVLHLLNLQERRNCVCFLGACSCISGIIGYGDDVSAGLHYL